MKVLKKVFIFLICSVPGVLLHGWAVAALYYCSFPDLPALRVFSAAAYVLIVLLFILLRSKRVQAFLISLLGFMMVAFWFNSIQPKAGGEFPPELTLPYAELQGDVVALNNVRNSIYRSKDDFDVRYENRVYRLDELQTLDVMVNYWGMDAIAHTFLSFGFSDGKYLAVSVEIRPKIGQKYDMFQGFFKQYQLIYIWGDERDLVALRTNFKKENVYLYRTSMTPGNVRKMFLSMIERTNAIHQKPEFYNTLTQSCTNTLGNHLIWAGIEKIPFWKRRFLTGDVDRRLYENGLLQTRAMPFAELRANANIDKRAQASGQGEGLSLAIRTHLIE